MFYAFALPLYFSFRFYNCARALFNMTEVTLCARLVSLVQNKKTYFVLGDESDKAGVPPTAANTITTDTGRRRLIRLVTRTFKLAPNQTEQRIQYNTKNINSITVCMCACTDALVLLFWVAFFNSIAYNF